MRCISNKQAFSLVELSIVLVILGLLTGGILAGQSLIRASELRAVTSEYQRYATATQTFRDKYFAIPGDFNGATKFWGRLNGNADCATNSAAAVAAPGACDGDGDGMSEGGAGPGTSAEMLQFWRQLALAGLIEGSYSGLGGPTVGILQEHVLGTNAPRSKISTAGWGAIWAGVTGGSGNAFAADYGNYFGFGSPLTGNGLTLNFVIKPEEAWNIDTKMDDGKPGTGKIMPYTWGACTTAANQTDNAAAQYDLIDTSIACGLYFVRSF